MEMVNASQVAIELDLNALPILEGAKETIQQGFLSSLHPQNFAADRFVHRRKVCCIADRPDILLGLNAPDDAAVVTVPSGQVMVQTVDYFRSLLSDPFIFGQIAANHALSDLFAMGAMPQSAMAIVTLPYSSASKQEETLYQVLSGAMQILSQANAALIGGHTIEGAELAFGLSCNGLATADQLWKKGGMQPGQSLILTKPLGTGTLFAANMQLRAKGRWIEGAIASMQQTFRR